MKYSVVWTDDAAADFLELWVSSSDQAAVTAAARVIDQVLENEPLHERHEVVRGFGTVIRAPVGVDFWLDEGSRKVVVTTAWPVREVE
jgi:plasmid stabilization system protein ParE